MKGPNVRTFLNQSKSSRLDQDGILDQICVVVDTNPAS